MAVWTWWGARVRWPVWSRRWPGRGRVLWPGWRWSARRRRGCRLRRGRPGDTVEPRPLLADGGAEPTVELRVVGVVVLDEPDEVVVSRPGAWLAMVCPSTPGVPSSPRASGETVEPKLSCSGGGACGVGQVERCGAAHHGRHGVAHRVGTAPAAPAAVTEAAATPAPSSTLAPRPSPAMSSAKAIRLVLLTGAVAVTARPRRTAAPAASVSGVGERPSVRIVCN